MAEPFYLYTRRQGGNYYVQFSGNPSKEVLFPYQELYPERPDFSFAILQQLHRVPFQFLQDQR